jgi:hypothetical protein
MPKNNTIAMAYGQMDFISIFFTTLIDIR